MAFPVPPFIHTNIPVDDSNPLPSLHLDQETSPGAMERRGSFPLTQSLMEMNVRDQMAVQQRQELARAVYAQIGYLLTPLDYVSKDRPLPALLRTNDLSHLPVLGKFRETLACPVKVREDGKSVDELLPRTKEREKQNIRTKHNARIKDVDDILTTIRSEYIDETKKIPSRKPTKDDVRRFEEVRERLIQRIDECDTCSTGECAYCFIQRPSYATTRGIQGR